MKGKKPQKTVAELTEEVRKLRKIIFQWQQYEMWHSHAYHYGRFAAELNCGKEPKRPKHIR